MSCNGMASSFFPPNFLLQMQTPHDDDSHHHHPHPRHPSASLSPLLPTSSCPNPQDYHAVAALLGKRSSMSFSGMDGGGACEEMNGEDDLSDDCSQAGEKKRRLNMEQVKTLEKNFELGNKLEPERKMQLARALGLQPRQIAIWFQNRRARWKTKQLEKDYDVLKRQFEAVKSENDALQAHNKKLQAEIMALRGGGCTREISEPINLNKDTEGSCSNRSDNSSDVNLDISRAPAAIDSPLNHPHHNHQSTRHSFFHPIRPPVPPPPQPPGVPNQLLHHPKIEHGSGGGNVVQDESFCSMFCTLDDQPAFWTAPWTEQQSFH